MSGEPEKESPAEKDDYKEQKRHLCCPNCSASLYNKSCKWWCPACGYHESCADG